MVVKLHTNTCNIVDCEDNWAHNTKYFSGCEDVVTVLHFLTTTSEKTLYVLIDVKL